MPISMRYAELPHDADAIAAVLEAESPGWARSADELRHGHGRLWVTNDEPNHAMRALNERLGFVPTGAMLRFVKRLEAAGDGR